ncbi:MAG: hypothetical protein LDL56_08860 [Armatimonadetes bacterium]|nr:hypothetical protein [Armatimonadota bacterium]
MGSIVLVSTCGTSSLSHDLSSEERKLLNQWANVGSEAEIPAGERPKLEELVLRQVDALERASPEEARRRSAEINGILSYTGNAAEVQMHYLVRSDTVLGIHAADAVERWLRAQGARVEQKPFPGLQVQDQNRLDQALADCARWVAEELQWVRSEPSRRLVFHTTGGFKAVQGFFQTLGLLYAEETVYLFEGSSELMRIPRLPLLVDLGFLTDEQRREVRRLRLGLDSRGTELPETLAARGRLTAFGRLLADAWWEKEAAGGLLPEISDRIRFGPDFAKTVTQENPSRWPTINRRLEDLARWAETGQDLRSLDVKQLRGGARQGSTHEADAWHDGGAKRFFLHRDAEVWVVDRVGEALP